MSDRKVIGEIYSSKLFSYDSTAKRFTSTFSQVPGVLRTLWEDDLALGFGIRSLKTGRVVFFVLTKANRSETGYASWEFTVNNNHNESNISELVAIILNQ